MDETQSLDTLGKRLKWARRRAKLTQLQVRKRIGISQSNLSELEGDAYLASAFVPQLANLYGVRALWLSNKQGPVLESDLLPSSNDIPSPHQAQSNVAPVSEALGRVPLISWGDAGMWDESVDVEAPGYAQAWVPMYKGNRKNAYALRVEGDSMTAPYGDRRSCPDGVIVMVDPDQRAPASGKRVIAKLAGSGQVTLKVYVEEDGRRWLKPLNPLHPPIYDAFEVIGTVVATYDADD